MTDSSDLSQKSTNDQEKASSAIDAFMNDGGGATPDALDSVANMDAYYTADHERVDPERAKGLEGYSNRELMFQFLKNLGEDPKREGLKRTPYRIEKAWEFITEGYHMDVRDFLNRAVFPQECDDIVLVKDIRFYSMCEHHLLPFYGMAHVAYIPDGKVVGLSKLPRIVDMYARRLQIQEQLCNQVADCIQDVLKPKGVAVIMTGFHFCMMMRGVQKDNAKTTTSAMLGAFRESYETRTELMHLLNQSTI